MRKLGGTPGEPDDWVDDEGTVWTIGKEGIKDRRLERAIERGATKGLWVRAAKHYCGSGLEKGGDLTAARKLRAKLVK